MLEVNSSGEDYPSNWVRICDTCHAAACVLYSHNDSVYLCHRGDESIHAANPMALQHDLLHERVWVCTACENAPAAFTCQADAASPCINCDIEIHSANPVAHRHARVPILPLCNTVCTSSTSYLEELQGPVLDTEVEITSDKRNKELEDETDSWLLLENNDNQTTNGFTYGKEADEFLDLEYNSFTKYQYQSQNDQQQLSSIHQGDSGSDNVPVLSFEAKDQQQQQQQKLQQQNIYFNRGHEDSKAASINTAASSRGPMSFTNAGYLLKETTSDVSNSYTRYPKVKTDFFPNPSLMMPPQFTPTNREARVLRYREKRKARKFEKKIRYASRKANAETRPRVNGRFARKVDMDMEFEVDQMFLTEDYGYGIVPSY